MPASKVRTYITCAPTLQHALVRSAVGRRRRSTETPHLRTVCACLTVPIAHTAKQNEESPRQPDIFLLETTLSPVPCPLPIIPSFHHPIEERQTSQHPERSNPRQGSSGKTVTVLTWDRDDQTPQPCHFYMHVWRWTLARSKLEKGNALALAPTETVAFTA